MARRPAYTLLLLNADATARIDFGPGPDFAVIAGRRQPAAGTEDPAMRTGQALALGGQVGRTVWVFWEGAWTQTVDMPAAAVMGLTSEQLGRSLAFEVEPLSAIPATESLIEAIPVAPVGAEADPTRQTFWITQVSVTVREAVEALVRKAGGKFGGLLHPGGLPRSGWGSTPPAGGEWRRVEVWDQATVILSGRGADAPAIRIVNSRPGSPGWSAHLPAVGPVTWTARTPAPEVLNDEGVPLEWVPATLPAESVPADWARAWAAELSARERRVPVIRAEERGAPNTRYFAIAGAAAAAVLVACAAHALPIYQATADAKAKADAGGAKPSEKALAARRDAVAKQEKALTAELESLRADIKALEKQEQVLAEQRVEEQKRADEIRARHARREARVAAHRVSLAALMESIIEAEQKDSRDLSIRAVRSEDGGRLRLSGWCTGPGRAEDLAVRLTKALTDAGWQVGPAQTKVWPDRPVWDFWIILTPRLLTDREPAPRSAGAVRRVPVPVAPTAPVDNRPSE